MARLGHTSLTETMETYGHLFPQGHTDHRCPGPRMSAPLRDRFLRHNLPARRLTRSAARCAEQGEPANQTPMGGRQRHASTQLQLTV